MTLSIKNGRYTFVVLAILAKVVVILKLVQRNTSKMITSVIF